MGILSIKDKHTDCNEAFETNKKSDASLIYSDAQMVEEFSIELSVGEQWAKDLSREKAVMYAIEGEEVSIKPHSSIVLEVKENIQVPFNMYGLILQTGSVFLEQGILIGAGKIEPSFGGKLRMLIYNTSKTTRTLKKGQKIASAIFMRTDKTITASIYKNNRTLVKENRGTVAKLIAFFTSDMRYTVSLIVSVVCSSLVASLLTYKTVSADNSPKPSQKLNQEISEIDDSLNRSIDDNNSEVTKDKTD